MLAVALQLATNLSPVAAVVKVVALDAREWLLVAGPQQYRRLRASSESFCALAHV